MRILYLIWFLVGNQYDLNLPLDQEQAIDNDNHSIDSLLSKI
jgi:hypothetical protein